MKSSTCSTRMHDSERGRINSGDSGCDSRNANNSTAGMGLAAYAILVASSLVDAIEQHDQGLELEGLEKHLLIALVLALVVPSSSEDILDIIVQQLVCLGGSLHHVHNVLDVHDKGHQGHAISPVWCSSELLKEEEGGLLRKPRLASSRVGAHEHWPAWVCALRAVWRILEQSVTRAPDQSFYTRQGRW